MRVRIDLEKAVGKIASRQSLNDVHILVQLVRKANSGDPSWIHIEREKKSWRVIHNGAPPTDEELRTLHRLLTHTGSLGDLDLIEHKFGVTLLTCCISFKEVVITGKSIVLKSQDKLWSISKNPESMQHSSKEWCVAFVMDRKPETDPKAELSFYCASTPIPIRFNGKKVNRRREVPSMILQSSWNTELGSGFVGIPEQEGDSTFFFYKRGVLFGVRHFTPPAGKVLYGFWDSPLIHFEREFQQSITQGISGLEVQGGHLYRQIPQFFERFKDAHKNQVKRILMNIPISLWDDAFWNIPLFHWGSGSFNFSLQQAKTNIKRNLSLPYDIRKNKDNALVLSQEEIYFLLRKVGLPLRRVVVIR